MCVVNKLFKVEEPDFVVKTHTAVTGVRGTDFGIRLQANSTTILNFSGVTQVGNIFPEPVGGLDRKIHHVAFSFGPPGSHNSGGIVDTGHARHLRGQSGLPPTLPFTITGEDREKFMNQLGGPLLSANRARPRNSSGSGPISQSNWAGPTPVLAPAYQFAPYAAIPAIATLGADHRHRQHGCDAFEHRHGAPHGDPSPAPAAGPDSGSDSGTDPIHLQLYPAILCRLYVRGSNAPYSSVRPARL